MGERRARGVREPDLDRAPGIELRDLLSRDHLLSRLDGWGETLIDVDDLACLGAVQQAVEDALTCRAGAAVGPAWRGDLQDARVADRVDGAAADEVDAHVDPPVDGVHERALVAGAGERRDPDVDRLALLARGGSAHPPGQILVRRHASGLHHALLPEDRLDQGVGRRAHPLMSGDRHAVDARDRHRVAGRVLRG